MTEALRRQSLLEAAAALIAAGRSQNAAAAELGVSSANLTRWRGRFAADGLAGLADQRESRCGRRPLAVLNEAEELLAKRYFVKMESKTSALRALAASPDCRPEIADAINKRRASKHTLTRALRDQISLPAQVIAYHKSPKNVRVNCFINPRSMTYLDALGAERQILPGDLFERDDMSNNFLCYVPWPWGGDPCSDKYGVRVARGQNLLMIDVRSLFFTSFNFLIRLRDSYRADDIWQWVSQTYRDIGLPRIGERWERGTWASRRLRGDSEVPIEAGHTDELARLGGMGALGLRVIESQSPTTKIIENRFNFFQRRCALIPTLQIGRNRGEMERETRLWMRMRSGHVDPRDYCLSFEQCSDEIEKALHDVNSEPVEGLCYQGIPAQVWSEGIAANPLARLAPEQGWLFSRDKREITARKGHVLLRYTTPEGHRAGWWFHHPEMYAAEGLKCSVYFDHYAPGEGATIVLAEGRKAGTVLGQAELVQGIPQFALGFQTGDDTAAADRLLGALERKKEFLDAVRSEYRALGIGGRRLARTVRVDDGAGRAVQISSGRCGAEGDPSPAVVELAHESAARLTPSRRAASEPVDFDAQLERTRRLEAEAMERGDLLPA
jgi:Helix-turn-helix domain